MYELPNVNFAFAKVLRAQRERARMTQMELAVAVGGSEAYVRRMERGRQTPTTTTLILLARALDLEPETFLAEIVRQMTLLDSVSGE